MAVPGNLSGEEGAPVKPKRETERGGRWAPVGGTREHPPQQGAPTPVVLPAHPGESQHGWTWAPRNSSNPQAPRKHHPHSIPLPMACPLPHGRMVQTWEGGVLHASAPWTTRICHTTPRNGGSQKNSTPGPFEFFFSLLFLSFLSCLLSFPADVSGTAGHSSTLVQRKSSQHKPVHRTQHVNAPYS